MVVTARGTAFAPPTFGGAHSHVQSPVPEPRVRIPEPSLAGERERTLAGAGGMAFERGSPLPGQGLYVQGVSSAAEVPQAEQPRTASQRIQELSAQFDALDDEHEKLVDEYSKFAVLPAHSSDTSSVSVGATAATAAAPPTSVLGPFGTSAAYCGKATDRSTLSAPCTADASRDSLAATPTLQPSHPSSSSRLFAAAFTPHEAPAAAPAAAAEPCAPLPERSGGDLQDIAIKYKATISDLQSEVSERDACIATLRAELEERTKACDALRAAGDAERHTADDAAARSLTELRTENDRLESELLRVKSLSYGEQKQLKRERDELLEEAERKARDLFELRESLTEMTVEAEQLKRGSHELQAQLDAAGEAHKLAAEAARLQHARELRALENESEKAATELQRQLLHATEELKAQQAREQLKQELGGGAWGGQQQAQAAPCRVCEGRTPSSSAASQAPTATMFQMQEASLQQEALLLSVQDENRALKKRVAAIQGEKDVLMKKLVGERDKARNAADDIQAPLSMSSHGSAHGAAPRHHRGLRLSTEPQPAASASAPAAAAPAPVSQATQATQTGAVSALSLLASKEPTPLRSDAFSEAFLRTLLALCHSSLQEHGVASDLAGLEAAALSAQDTEPLLEGLAAKMGEGGAGSSEDLHALQESASISDMKQLVSYYSSSADVHQTKLARTSGIVAWFRGALQNKINREMHKLSKEKRNQTEQQRAFELRCTSGFGVPLPVQQHHHQQHQQHQHQHQHPPLLSMSPTCSSTTRSSSLPLVSAATSAAVDPAHLGRAGPMVPFCAQRSVSPSFSSPAGAACAAPLPTGAGGGGVRRPSASDSDYARGRSATQSGSGSPSTEGPRPASINDAELRRKVTELEAYHNQLHERRMQEGLGGGERLPAPSPSDESTCSSFGKEATEPSTTVNVPGGRLAAFFPQRRHERGMEAADGGGGGASQDPMNPWTAPIPLSDDRILCLNALYSSGRGGKTGGQFNSYPSGSRGTTVSPTDAAPLQVVIGQGMPFLPGKKPL